MNRQLLMIISHLKMYYFSRYQTGGRTNYSALVFHCLFWKLLQRGCIAATVMELGFTLLWCSSHKVVRLYGKTAREGLDTMSRKACLSVKMYLLSGKKVWAFDSVYDTQFRKLKKLIIFCHYLYSKFQALFVMTYYLKFGKNLYEHKNNLSCECTDDGAMQWTDAIIYFSVRQFTRLNSLVWHSILSYISYLPRQTHHIFVVVLLQRDVSRGFKMICYENDEIVTRCTDAWALPDNQPPCGGRRNAGFWPQI